MTCSTCHDPHDIPRGPKAVDALRGDLCRAATASRIRGGAPRVPGVGSGRHMHRLPHAEAAHGRRGSRRDDRSLHSASTAVARSAGRAHRGRQPQARRLSRRGRLYYPPTLPPTPENELYLALAQVQQGSNLTAGIRRLEQAIEKHRPQRAEFYYELARAYGDGRRS